MPGRGKTKLYKILIVEDDPTLAGALADHLQRWGHAPVAVQQFEHIDQEFVRLAPQLVLMDITLPCYDGYYWCRRLRQFTQVPIIFLSSASDDLNQIMALSEGADDFIAKPFDPGVALAKITALLRRTYDFSAGSGLLAHRGAVLDLGSAVLTVGDRRSQLTRNEFCILRTLMEHKGQVVLRTDLMQRLWESDCYIDDNTLTVNIARLRKKLDSLGMRDLIGTQKGRGYLIPLGEEEEA